MQRLTYNNHKLDEFFDKVYKENAELKALSEELGKIIECKNGTIATLAKTRDKLKAENERLKDEVETRNNLIDHFRDEALYRATIASEYPKDKTKLEQTMQEIKEIAEFHITDDDSEDVQNDMEQIIDLITKAEEE